MKLNPQNRIDKFATGQKGRSRRVRLCDILALARLSPLVIGVLVVTLVPQTIVKAETAASFLVADKGVKKLPLSNWAPSQAPKREDTDGYLVYINRYDPDLLELVQQVEPEAMAVRYKRREVIQVGLYDESRARRRVNALRQKGILAEIAYVEYTNIRSQFMVFVVNDDPLLLDLVLQEAPDAFLSRYRGRDIIQAGIFDDEVRAARLVRRLREQSIAAEIANFNGRPNAFSFVNNDEPVEVLAGNYYSVLIPGDEDELPLIENQVRRLAPKLSTRRGVYQRRNDPNGPYVLVGPFQDRNTAENWSQYLQDFGLEDARVYYGR